jgi:transcriptional regulator with XRE-family HTH domain
MARENKSLPELIKTRRRVMRLTLEELGAMCGVSHAAVAHWEAGRRTPGAKQLHDISIALEMSDFQVRLMLRRLSQ